MDLLAIAADHWLGTVRDLGTVGPPLPMGSQLSALRTVADIVCKLVALSSILLVSRSRLYTIL